VEASTGKIGMGKTERKEGKGRSRKKEGREEQEEKEGENDGDKEDGRRMGDIGGEGESSKVRSGGKEVGAREVP